MIEQAKILQDDADFTPDFGSATFLHAPDILAKDMHQSPRRLQIGQHHLQQGGFPRARGPGEKLERSRFDLERQITQDLGSQPIAQTDILETDQHDGCQGLSLDKTGMIRIILSLNTSLLTRD